MNTYMYRDSSRHCNFWAGVINFFVIDFLSCMSLFEITADSEHNWDRGTGDVA